jgi:hypothetical protein
VPGHAADLILLNRPFLAKGLTMGQRICYAGINLFWLFPLSRLAFMLSPLLYIFFSLEIYQANIQEFGAYALTYLIASFAMQSYLYGKVRWPWVSELYEYIQSIMLVGSIVSVIRNPRKPTFNVTGKGPDTGLKQSCHRSPFLFRHLLRAARSCAVFGLAACDRTGGVRSFDDRCDLEPDQSRRRRSRIGCGRRTTRVAPQSASADPPPRAFYARESAPGQ